MMADDKTDSLDVCNEFDPNKNPANETNSVPEIVNITDTAMLESVKVEVLNDTSTLFENGDHDFPSVQVPDLKENSACLNDSTNLNTAAYLNFSALSDSPMSNDANENTTACNLSEIFENYLGFSGEKQFQEFNFPEPAPVVDEVGRKDNSFSKNQQGICEEEEFQDAVQFFKDPSSFQYLENINTSESSQLNILRDSLYLKFDPLHNRISQTPVPIDSRAGGDTLEEKLEANNSFMCDENAKNVISEVDQHISNVSTRESDGNVLMSFDTPVKINSVSEQSSISPFGNTHHLYTEEELQKQLKINELTLLDTHLNQQRKMEEKKIQQNLETQEENEKKIQEIEVKNAAKILQLEEDYAKKVQEIMEENARKIQEIEEEMSKKIQELQEENVMKIRKLEEENLKKIHEFEEKHLKKIVEIEQIFLKRVSEMEEEMLIKEKEILIKEKEVLRRESEMLSKEEMSNAASAMKEPTLRSEEMLNITIDMNEAVLKKKDETMENNIEENDDSNNLTNLCRNMYEVIEELKTIIVNLKEENNSLKLKKEELESATKILESELKTCSEDLQSVETTFSNFNKRYEQCKEMLKSCKENEDLYKNQIEHLNKKLEAKDNKYNMLQAKSEEMSKRADFEMSNSRKAVEARVAVLEAQLRKSELKNSSLDNDLKQIKIENEKLNNMYDDLIRKVSKS